VSGFTIVVHKRCFIFLFRMSKPEAMDDEVTKILKKWNMNNPAPTKDVANMMQNETFDTRTFTRPKRRMFEQSPSISTEPNVNSIESGVS
jgi:hypothetical protein